MSPQWFVVLWGWGTLILEGQCPWSWSQWSIMSRTTPNFAVQGCQQNIAQSITLPPTACLHPVLHPAAISSPNDTHASGRLPDLKENVIQQYFCVIVPDELAFTPHVHQ